MSVGTLLLAAAAAVAGLYQAQQMEVGAALELQKNGHFRYQLDYGAVSEHAEGDWTFDGKAVRLTTKPKPKAPRFELIRDDPAPTGEIALALEPPGFGEGYRLRAIGTDARSGEKGLVETDTEGRKGRGAVAVGDRAAGARVWRCWRPLRVKPGAGSSTAVALPRQRPRDHSL